MLAFILRYMISHQGSHVSNNFLPWRAHDVWPKKYSQPFLLVSRSWSLLPILGARVYPERPSRTIPCWGPSDLRRKIARRQRSPSSSYRSLYKLFLYSLIFKKWHTKMERLAGDILYTLNQSSARFLFTFPFWRDSVWMLLPVPSFKEMLCFGFGLF